MQVCKAASSEGCAIRSLGIEPSFSAWLGLLHTCLPHLMGQLCRCMRPDIESAQCARPDRQANLHNARGTVLCALQQMSLNPPQCLKKDSRWHVQQHVHQSCAGEMCVRHCTRSTLRIPSIGLLSCIQSQTRCSAIFSLIKDWAEHYLGVDVCTAKVLAEQIIKYYRIS